MRMCSQRRSVVSFPGSCLGVPVFRALPGLGRGQQHSPAGDRRSPLRTDVKSSYLKLERWVRQPVGSAGTARPTGFSVSIGPWSQPVTDLRRPDSEARTKVKRYRLGVRYRFHTTAYCLYAPPISSQGLLTSATVFCTRRPNVVQDAIDARGNIPQFLGKHLGRLQPLTFD